jgi:hypothetical protein
VPADTDYYLRLTAESYPHITARLQSACGDVEASAAHNPALLIRISGLTRAG